MAIRVSDCDSPFPGWYRMKSWLRSLNLNQRFPLAAIVLDEQV
jgi:hypothetical protein